MATRPPPSEKVLKKRVERARKQIRGAIDEIRTLMSQAQKGTLDRKRLESGLEKLSRQVKGIDDHWPHSHGP